MQVKRKNKLIRLVFAVGISVIIFGAPGDAAAEDAAFSGALHADLPQAPISGQAAASDSPFSDLSVSNTKETAEISMVTLPENRLNLLPGEWCQIEWFPAKMIGPQALIEPMGAYHRIDVSQPLLGFSWGRGENNRNKWKVVFGPGGYVSNYHDRNHPTENRDPEEPVSNRDEADLFEELKNMLKVVGIQIRYDF